MLYICREFSIAIKSLPKLVFGYNFLYFNFFVLTVYLQILIFLARIVLSSVLGFLSKCVWPLYRLCIEMMMHIASSVLGLKLHISSSLVWAGLNLWLSCLFDRLQGTFFSFFLYWLSVHTDLYLFFLLCSPTSITKDYVLNCLSVWEFSIFYKCVIDWREEKC